MRVQELTIHGRLATLNEHDAANRSNKFVGAKLKKQMTELVALQCSKLKPISGECIITCHWFYSTRHDFDNVRFGIKFCMEKTMGKIYALEQENKDLIEINGKLAFKVRGLAQKCFNLEAEKNEN